LFSIALLLFSNIAFSQNITFWGNSVKYKVNITSIDTTSIIADLEIINEYQDYIYVPNQKYFSIYADSIFLTIDISSTKEEYMNNNHYPFYVFQVDKLLKGETIKSKLILKNNNLINFPEIFIYFDYCTEVVHWEKESEYLVKMEEYSKSIKNHFIHFKNK